MEKHSFKFCLIAITLSFLSIFSACKSKIDITGTWYKSKQEFVLDGKVVGVIENLNDSIQFKTDGTGFDSQGPFNWHFNGDTLFVFDQGIRYDYVVILHKKKVLIIEDRSIQYYNDEESEIIRLTFVR